MFENFEIRAAQNCENLVDLEKRCKMTIYLQRSAPIQPRTSLGKCDVSWRWILALAAAPAALGLGLEEQVEGLALVEGVHAQAVGRPAAEAEVPARTAFSRNFSRGNREVVASNLIIQFL